MRGSVLIIVQVVLFIYIVFISGPFMVSSLPFWIIQLAGIVIMLWAFVAKSLHKKRPGFSSRKEKAIIKEGPYEFIRHPVDAGVLLFVLAYAEDNIMLGRFLGVGLFVIIMLLMVNEEEKKAEQYFKKDYTDYKKNTKKIIPYIY